MTQTLTAGTAQHAHSHAQTPPQAPARWRVADVVALYELPFNDLLYRAQTVHREPGDDR